ncbi:hypothetical protein JWJ88_17155 [Paracoccus methylovorus]|uniref:Uncharacterized protein n=1 Tax=Paracoccus methylovorus TaxID=2812658 RepID=A0ABX7JKD2_9RHOB|nr:hypothetical protein [Paracoccus methylovorus]QRZ14692.1 hypothetical protein JWJ88_17155 [Paracoccus methylovorus]
MTDTKAPERIWAFEDYPSRRAEPRSGWWIDEQSECPEGSPGYIRADLHDALAKQRDKLAAEIERLTAHAESGWAQSRYWMDRYHVAADERDAALAREAAVIEVAGNTAAERCAACGASDISSLVREYIRRLTPIDAQAALDKLIADARSDGIKDTMELLRRQINSMRLNVGAWLISDVPEAINDTLDDILALINEPQEGDK